LGYDACTTTTVHRLCWCHDFTSFYGDSIVSTCTLLLRISVYRPWHLLRLQPQLQRPTAGLIANIVYSYGGEILIEVCYDSNYDIKSCA
jgi:hypothetical protein